MTVNPVGGSGGDDGRDGACTPEWLATMLGWFDLDPCGNRRSKILASRCCGLEWGDNGLLDEGIPGSHGRCVGTQVATSKCRVFVNPPYARGQVIK